MPAARRTALPTQPHSSGQPTPDASVRADAERRLQRVERVARRWDASWRVPYTNFRFGWDALVGLVPGVGDLAGLAVSLWIVREASQLGAPTGLKASMLATVVAEALLGAVPVFGDMLDAVWKANQRNARRLRRHLERRGAVAPEPASS